MLNTLRRFVYGKDTLDMLITNFVYEKQGAKHKKAMNYNTALPKNEVFTWDDVKVFIAGQYILMHLVIYRTELLRDCGLELPMIRSMWTISSFTSPFPMYGRCTIWM